MTPTDADAELRRLTRELDNFQSIAKYLVPLPGDVPRLNGIDVWGGSLQLNGSVGGDHITYVDFKHRFDLQARIARAREEGRHEVADNLEGCQRKAGIAVIDVAGHQMTDALLAAMLHQAFLLGALYELDRSGQITRRLFENLNTRFYQSSGTHKYLSMIYGEISEDAKFRFLSAGVPFPAVFSNHHNRFMEVSEHVKVSFPPLGMMPSFNVIDRSMTRSLLGFKERYEMNEWSLMGRGDILLLHTDGLSDHRTQDQHYFPARLEQMLREVKHLGAREHLRSRQEGRPRIRQSPRRHLTCRHQTEVEAGLQTRLTCLDLRSITDVESAASSLRDPSVEPVDRDGGEPVARDLAWHRARSLAGVRSHQRQTQHQWLEHRTRCPKRRLPARRSLHDDGRYGDVPDSFGVSWQL